jgi:hypothetical protein
MRPFSFGVVGGDLKDVEGWMDRKTGTF